MSEKLRKKIFLPNFSDRYQCEELELTLKTSDTKILHLINKQEELNQEMVATYLLNLTKSKMKEYHNIKLS